MARILIVEDEAPLRRILTINLVRRGHTVAEADDVATAQEILLVSGSVFDLILLDINLPDGSGWDVLRGFNRLAGAHDAAALGGRSAGAVCPRVIALTAVRPVRCRLEEFQPAALLLKPFPIGALLRLIERELAREDGEAPAGSAVLVEESAANATCA